MLNYQNYWHVPNFEHQFPENNTRQRNDPNNAKTRQNLGGDTSRQVWLRAFSQFNLNLLGLIEEQTQTRPWHYTANTHQAKNQAKTSANWAYACWRLLVAEASLGLPIGDWERGLNFSILTCEFQTQTPCLVSFLSNSSVAEYQWAEASGFKHFCYLEAGARRNKRERSGGSIS